jgi:hypothetical protein
VSAREEFTGRRGERGERERRKRKEREKKISLGDGEGGRRDFSS